MTDNTLPNTVNELWHTTLSTVKHSIV